MPQMDHVTIAASKARAAEQAEENRTDGRQSARQRHSPTRADLIAQHAPHQRQAGVENHEHRSDQANLGCSRRPTSVARNRVR